MLLDLYCSTWALENLFTSNLKNANTIGNFPALIDIFKTLPVES